MATLTPVSENYGTTVRDQLSWSVVSAVRGSITERAEVSGGWLYRTTVVHDDGQMATAMTFVPSR